MQQQSSNRRPRHIFFLTILPERESGQITVYAALSFLIIMGISFLVLEGMRDYQISLLEEDAVAGAGEYIKANYDNALFARYHILALDPREKAYLETDAKEYFEGYYGADTFFGLSCLSVLADEQVAITDEDGKILKSEIREWMKYRKIREAGSVLKTFLLESDSADKGAKRWKAEIGRTDNGSAGQDSSEGGDRASPESGDNPDPGKEENAMTDPESAKYRICFQEIRETLEMVMRSGTLYYVADDAGALSKLKVSLHELPSRKEGLAGPVLKSGETAFSFGNVRSLLPLFSADGAGEFDFDDGIRLLEDEYLTLSYVKDYFSSYVCEGEAVKKDQDDSEDHPAQHALAYEREYMICGSGSDLENLRTVVNRILLIRFAANYLYARTDSEISTEAKTMGACLSGILGLPEAEKAVELLLIGALAYGETLLEIHALLCGEKAALVKTSDNWNLTFANAANKLRDKSPVKNAGKMVSYEDYLSLFLIAGGSNKKLYYRMMDLMQLNIALEEPGFCMEEALFSFRLQAEFKTGKWFSRIPVFGLKAGPFLRIKPERIVTY